MNASCSPQAGAMAAPLGSLATPQGLSKIRHDLRDRLAAVQGYGEILLDYRDCAGWDRWRPGLLALHQTTGQLLRQLNQALEWSRWEAGSNDLPGLQNAIRTFYQAVEEMVEHLTREIGVAQHPASTMLPRYAGAAKKLFDLYEHTIAVPNFGRDSDGLPAGSLDPSPDEPPMPNKEGTILVADDSEENRHLLSHHLGRQGYTVHLVSDGPAALAFAQANPVDLLLLDFLMPGLNGLEVLKRVKADPRTNHLPVIMLSSSDAAATVIRSLQLGADDFLPKPFSPPLLAARVESSLAKKRLREREKTFYELTLRLHLGRGRARQILENPHLLRPGAVKQEVSFLFSDISNFSLIADRAAADRLFKLLNKYYQETIGCIHEHQGTVMQLVGDSIFAIWNAPEAQPDHQMLACRAAWALRKRLHQFNQELKDTSDDRLETRLGLHAGDASVGNLGSDDRFEFAAIGANTNLASRLEGLNKHLGTEVLMSEEMLTAAEASGFLCRALGRYKLKGLDRVVKVFELFGEKASQAAAPPWFTTFNQALRLFNEGEFAKAKKAFKDVLRTRGDGDGPSRFYLDYIEKLQKDKPDPEWLGVVKLESK